MTNIYVIDIETTGTDPAFDEIIEVGGVLHQTEQPDMIRDGACPAWGVFQSLCRANCPVPPESSAIHHLTDWHLTHAPDVGVALLNMLSGMPNAPVLCAHEAAFEREFLQDKMKDIRGVEFQPQWICTRKLAQTLFPAAPSHSNAGMFYYLKLHDQAPQYWDNWFSKNPLHRSISDAKVTAALLRVFLKYVSVHKAIHISANPVVLTRVPFGQHRGRLWEDMDIGFLDWVIDRDFSEDVLHTARHHRDILLSDDEGA